MTRYEVGSASDTGAVRKQNEDSVGYFQLSESGWTLFVVCDGMGGHKAGEKASAMAVELIGQGFADRVQTLSPEDSLADSIHDANQQIYEAASTNPDWSGMGTTCVALALKEMRGYLGHIGDSRAYIIRGDTITRLTQDHTAVARMVDAGMLSQEEGDAHPNAGVLEKCIGPEPEVEAEIHPALELQPGDRVLLCSDGIYGPIDEPLLAAMAVMYPPQEACEKLIRLSIERGGDDNASLQIVHIKGAAPPTGRFEPERFREPAPKVRGTSPEKKSSGVEIFKPTQKGREAGSRAGGIRIMGLPLKALLALGAGGLLVVAVVIFMASGPEEQAPGVSSSNKAQGPVYQRTSAQHEGGDVTPAPEDSIPITRPEEAQGEDPKPAENKVSPPPKKAAASKPKPKPKPTAEETTPKKTSNKAPLKEVEDAPPKAAPPEELPPSEEANPEAQAKPDAPPKTVDVAK